MLLNPTFVVCTSVVITLIIVGLYGIAIYLDIMLDATLDGIR